MDKISLNGMVFFAHHGYFHEEREKGNKFVVDMILETDLQKAAESDKLADTVDYEQIYNVVKAEMEKHSHLLENVAYRIIESMKKNFPGLKKITLKVSKYNPPIKGMVDNVSVTLESR